MADSAARSHDHTPKPLTEQELEELDVYNAECARGILHTARWILRMIDLQHRFDATYKALDK